MIADALPEANVAGDEGSGEKSAVMGKWGKMRSYLKNKTKEMRV